MVDPRIMCRQHLLGEHCELGMFVGSLKKKISISGYLRNNCLEPKSIELRHKELIVEMLRRGYNHNSPLLYENDLISYLPIEHQNYKIDKDRSLELLLSRCALCRVGHIVYGAIA